MITIKHNNNNPEETDNKSIQTDQKIDETLQQSTSYKAKQEAKLIKELIRKEAVKAKTEKKIKALSRNIKHIEQSKTWRYTKPLRKLSSFTAKVTGRKKIVEQRHYIRELETSLKEMQKAYFQVKERLHESSLDDRMLNSSEIRKIVDELKDGETLIDYLEYVIQSKHKHEQNYIEAITMAARSFIDNQEIYKNWVYSRALTGLKIEDIPEFMIRSGLSEDNIPLNEVSSYRASLNMRMRQMQLVESLPEWVLDDKQLGYSFAKKLNIRTPWISNQVYQTAAIPREKGTVIKPAEGAGSRGVYLVYDLNDIVDIKRAENLGNWGELESSMEKDLKTGWVDEDKWFIEELIFENDEKKMPARDIKFYCFYGKVGLILEISRYPERKHCWWTSDGQRVRTGKYEDELFKGNGVSEADVNLVSDLSLQIPAPFIRIDFLQSHDGLVFGEFTPKPGNYDEFDKNTDQQLGDYFMEAEGRLMDDLLNGKQFHQYKALLTMHDN